MPSKPGSVPPGRRVLRIQEAGGDSLVFHYDDDREPATYAAKTALVVSP